MSLQAKTPFLFRILPSVLAIVVIILACLVLAGWLFNLPQLTSLIPNTPVMTVNTAVIFLLAATAMLLYNIRTPAGLENRHRLALALSVAVVIIALLTLGQYLFGWNFGIDQLLLEHQEEARYPGRPSPHTALTFLLSGVAMILMLQNKGWRSTVAQLFLLTAAIIPQAAIVGYSYQITSFFSIDTYTGMAIPTATSFLCLVLGMLTLQPEHGLVGILTANNLGGMMSRRLLLAALLIPLIIGWLTILGESAGLYNIQAQFVFLAVLSTYALAVAILWYAQSLNNLESRQQEAESHFRKTVESSPIAIIQVDVEGRIQMINDQTQNLFGYSKDEIVGLPVEMLVPESLRSGHGSHRQQYLENAAARPMGAGRDLFGRHKNGTQIPIEIGLSPMTYEGQTFVLASIIDITERKQAESEIKELLQREKLARLEVVKLNEELELRVQDRTRRLETANKELEAFSYSVSHDLRAPLRSIDGFSQVILEDYIDKLDSTGQHYLNRVRAGSQKMAGLIDDLLMLSRLSRAKMSFKSVNLSQMAVKILDDLRELEPERQVTTHIQPDVMIEADPRLIEVVLTNLLNNAWKFTSHTAHPFIEFGAEQGADGRRTYFVRDNGAGFDMNYANKLFQPFQRLHSETEFPGTGIGLATIQRIIARHDGTLRAEGQLDKGATFYFTINGTNTEKGYE